jgi:non-specific protein-tyrosine kinase
MDLRYQIRLLRSWSWFLVGSVLIAGAIAFLVSAALPRVYEGKVTLIVGQGILAGNANYNQVLASQQLAQTYARVVATGPILAGVIAKTGLAMTPEELSKKITAEAPLNLTLVYITVQAGDSKDAALLANTLAAEMIAASPVGLQNGSTQQFIEADLAATQTQIEETQTEILGLTNLSSRTVSEDQQLQDLQTRVAGLRQTYAATLNLASSNGANLLTVVDPAVPPDQPVSPRVLVNVLVAMLFGLVVALGFVFVYERLDDTVRSREAVEEITGLPTLGTITRMKSAKGRNENDRLVTLLYPQSPVGEAYRTLRANIEFASVDRPLKTLLVTSSMPGEGKTITAANLAVVFAQGGHRTVLLDADFRKPGVHRIFGLPNAQGLSGLLRSDEVDIVAVAEATEQENLAVITTGPLPPNPAELIGSQRMKAILDRLTAAVELVIIDSPPLGVVSDPAILAAMTDGTLFVVDAGRTRRSAVQGGREALAKANARVLGVVLNRLAESSVAYYGQYGARPDDQDRDTNRSIKPVGDDAG